MLHRALVKYCLEGFYRSCEIPSLKMLQHFFFQVELLLTRTYFVLSLFCFTLLPANMILSDAISHGMWNVFFYIYWSRVETLSKSGIFITDANSRTTIGTPWF